MNEMNRFPQDDAEAGTEIDVPVQNMTSTDSAAGWPEVGQDWREVGEEFKKLGMRLSSAIKSGWQSGQEQELTGLQDQLRAMADQVESAVRSAREEALSPETKAQTQRALAVAKEAQATLVEEVRDTVATGLRALNAQLRELADRLDTGRK